ncbi:MAG: SH3 domain-containing protein [Treponema sp.]|nr:SH3 domain-containing protein [Candidatus Treponema merdequi]
MKKFSTLVFLFFILSFNLSAHPTATVNEDRVRVRNAPSITYSKTLTVVLKNQSFKIFNKTEDKDTIDGFTSEWYEIKYDDNNYGWIYGAYIDIKNDENDYIHETTKTEAITQALYEELYFYFWNGESYNATINDIKCKNYSLIDTHSYTMKCSDGTYGTATQEIYNVDGHIITMGLGWETAIIKKTIPNSFSVKIGMTKEDLQKMLGPEIKNHYWTYIYGDEACIAFNFENNILSSIYIDRNPFTGD